MLYQLSYCGAVVKCTGCLRFLIPARKREISSRREIGGAGRIAVVWRAVRLGFASASVPSYNRDGEHQTA